MPLLRPCARFPAQVSLTFGERNSLAADHVKCAMRMAVEDPPGAYVCIFASGVVPHGAALLPASSNVAPMPFLPWHLHHQLERVAQSSWHLHGPLLGIHVPLSRRLLNGLYAKLWQDMGDVGGPVACVRVGIIRGGGLPHGTFASAVRDMPVFEEIYRWVSEVVAQQALPPGALVQCWDGLVHNIVGDAVDGQPFHLDAKGSAYLQCEICLWPLPRRPAIPGLRLAGQCLRIGLLTSWAPAHESALLHLLQSFAARHSMKEDTVLHRCGPKCRPVPPHVIGGPILTKAQVEKLSFEDLYQYVEANCVNPVIRKQARTAAATWREMLAVVPEQARPTKTSRVACDSARLLADPVAPLTSADLELLSLPKPDDTQGALEVVKAARPKTSPADKRTLVLRGLMAGCSSYGLRVHAGFGASMVNGATAALKRCRAEQSMGPALWFASRSSRSGKQRKY